MRPMSWRLVSFDDALDGDPFPASMLDSFRTTLKSALSRFRATVVYL